MRLLWIVDSGPIGNFLPVRGQVLLEDKPPGRFEGNRRFNYVLTY